MHGALSTCAARHTHSSSSLQAGHYSSSMDGGAAADSVNVCTAEELQGNSRGGLFRAESVGRGGGGLGQLSTVA